MVRRNKKEEVNIIALILVSLAVLFLVQNSGTFMGAFITTVNNTEPLSITDWNNQTVTLNGTIAATTDFSFIDNVTTVNLTTYELTGTELGVLQISDANAEGYDCSAVLDLVKDNVTNSTYSNIEFRSVLITSGEYKWCNDNDHLVLSSSSISTITEYQNLYVERIQTEIALSSTSCVNAGFDWNGAECLCDDEETIVTSINFTCPEPPESTATVTSSSTSTASTSTPSISSGSSSTTISAQSTPEEPKTYIDKGLDWIKDNQLLSILLGVILFLVIYYAAYEKGPGGLFKNF